MPDRRKRTLRWLAGGTGLVLALLALFPVTGCAISTPYRSVAGVGPTADDDTVLVALTHAEIAEGTSTASAFWSNVSAVADSLEGRPGLLGYRLRRELFGRNSWTMTVWTDEASLEAFIGSDIHQTAIREGWPALDRARFARVTVPLSEIPLSWDRAKALLDAQDREYVNRYAQ